MQNFNQKCPNTPKRPNTHQLYTTNALFNRMFQYLYIVHYRHTLQRNVSIPLLYTTDALFNKMFQYLCIV